jgi:glutamate synthase (NADPH/NADH) small chain
MDCGVPFCHNGCPLGNHIPEWNDLTQRGEYEAALRSLLSTNNFPEFTGRICPAPCESACVLGINRDPVAIESIEMSLADLGFSNGWIRPEPPTRRTGRKIAIVGSGPTGLAAAQQLNRMGHEVTVFEKNDRPGGLLMYGIPDFKLEKEKVMRRVQLLEAEGITFCCGVSISTGVHLEDLKKRHCAVLLACGAGQAREMDIPGRSSHGIWLAEDYLRQSTRRVLGEQIENEIEIHAEGKDVIVIGGGDTGSDCIGTANRQGAKSIIQFEITAEPPTLPKHPKQSERMPDTPWPRWPRMLRTTSSHEEGCHREWSLETVGFEKDAAGHVQALLTREIKWIHDTSGKMRQVERENSEKRWPCQMVLIAIGYTGPKSRGMLVEAGIELNSRGCVAAAEHDFQTNIPGVFSAGDMRRGQSLVVWAIAEGRKSAEAINAYLSRS